MSATSATGPTFGDKLAGLLGIGTAIGGGLLVGDAMDRLSNIGYQAQMGTTLEDGTVIPGAQQIAQSGLEQSQFQPFTVTTTTGGKFGYDPQSGQVTSALGQQGQAAQDALFTNAQTMFGQTPFGMQGIQDASGQSFGLGSQFMQQAGMSTADREAAIYDRIRAMQAPGEERAAMELEERLASQGRLGVQTNQYGGTPEQLAQAKAQAEAQNTAAYQAIQQAQREQAQQAALGARYAGLGASLAGQGQGLSSAQQSQALQALQGAYIPQRELQAAQQAAQLFPQLQQRGQLYGAGLFGEASMGGLEAMLGAELGRANLLGELGSGLLGGALGGSDSFLGQFLEGLG